MPLRIEAGTPEADLLGFSEKHFSGGIELHDDRRLYAHGLITKDENAGNTRNLIIYWILRGYDVRVVRPRPEIQLILQKFCFVPLYEFLPANDDVNTVVWRLQEHERCDLRNYLQALWQVMKIVNNYSACNPASIFTPESSRQNAEEG